jgi:DNA-binding transcriptional LysR family regulator
MVTFQKKLTIRHLRLISVLGRELSISRCATALHTSQSAVSRSLTEIEALLGTTLFDRTTRRCRPTSLGQTLVWHAEQVLSQLDRAEADFDAVNKGGTGAINIGIIGSFSPSVLAEATRIARREAPELTIRLRSNFADGLVGDLMRGQCDLALTHLDVREFGKDLVADVLYDDRIAVLASVSHPLAGRKRLDWNALGTYPWALTPVQTLTRRAVERNLRLTSRSQTPIVVETMDLHYVIEFVNNAGFLTAMSAELAGWFEATLGTVKRLPVVGGTAVLTVCAVHLRSRPLSTLENLFIASLKTASKSHAIG